MPIAKNGHCIATLEDWEAHAPPKAKHHWADHRSAKEVARAWLAGDGLRFPEEVDAALAAHPRFGRVLAWECEPEAKLPFDDFPGEPRNSDLAIIATDAAGAYVLAVEAKADEPYGETVADAFFAALERRIGNPRSNGIARIEGLARLLFPPAGRGAPRVGELRYQLLTACAGAVAEAARQGVSRTVMLVHEFVTPKTKDILHERNTADLARFLHRLAGNPIEDFREGRLFGPYLPPGAPDIELFVGKVSRHLR